MGAPVLAEPVPFPELTATEISGRGLYLPQKEFSLYIPLPVTGMQLKNMDKRICERQVAAQVTHAHGEPLRSAPSGLSSSRRNLSNEAGAVLLP